MTKFFRKDYCSGHNRAGQGTPASFINPRDTRDTDATQSFLVTKSASPVHAAFYAEILMVRSEM